MAVKNKPTLIADKIVAFADNNTEDIQASDLRGQQGDIIDSMLALVNPTLQTVTSDVNFTGNVSLPMGTVGYELVLSATSLAASQLPSPLAVNTVRQIEFGAAQFTGADPVMISALGAVTFNQTGSYFIAMTFNFGKDTGGGSGCAIVTMFKENGAYVAAMSTSMMTDTESRNTFSSSAFAVPAAATVWTFELLRDGAYGNDGGLYNFNPQLVGLPDVPTATINIYRLQ